MFHAEPGDEEGARPHLCASGGGEPVSHDALARICARQPLLRPVLLGRRRMGSPRAAGRIERLILSRDRTPGTSTAPRLRVFTPRRKSRASRSATGSCSTPETRSATAASDELMIQVCDLPYESQRGLARLPLAAGVLRNRWRARRAPRLGAPPPLPQAHRWSPDLVPSYSYGSAQSQQSARCETQVARHDRVRASCS